jgi:N-acetylglutamate synthase-like GNAT family acetyltransferase
LLKNNLNTTYDNPIFILGNKEYQVSCDPQRIDTEDIYKTLSQQSYWANDLTKEQFSLMKNSSVFYGMFQNTHLQIGFARVISDFVYMAYLADVFVKKEFRQKGLGKFLISSILSDKQYTHLKKWLILTKDADTFYEKFGFRIIKNSNYMELLTK